MSDMKLIMERWDGFLKEDIENPTTWGELAQKILISNAASKWPRLGKAFLKAGIKMATGAAKQAMDVIDDLEDVWDFVPDEMQKKLEAGSDEAAEWLKKTAHDRGGIIGAFIVDDIMGMDDSLSKNLAGFKELDIDKENEALLDKKELKKWAKAIIRYAKVANPDDPLPNLNQDLEKYFHKKFGAHPDSDEPDIRGD